MGVVYAAQDDRLGRQVALKFVPEELAKDRQAIDRLRSEARTASSLNHPNICTIYDIGEYDGRPFIVMELLKGQTLRERLTAGPLKVHDAVELGIHVADALDSAHHRGIMHRDIKPANLFLVERGQVKILDFGLAKLVRPPHASTTTQSTRDRDHTAEGVTLGTVSYMSPEQVTGELLDGRTDLFSLGVVLYECLTGHQPFTGKTSAVIFSAILTRAPVAPVVFNPEMPLRLQEVINNCLEKDRELRYQDAAGLRADLKRVKRDIESGHSGVFRIGSTTVNTTATIASGPQQVAHDSGSRARLEQSGQTRQPVTAIAAAVFVGVALAIVVSLVVWQRTRPTPTPATAGTSQNFVRSRIGLASASLDAKDYRAAVAYADEALRVAPDDADAKRIREAAQAILTRFDQAVARARQRLAAGDPDGASTAINEARSIEPGAAVVGELSTALVTQLRTQADAARRDAQNSRSTPPPPPARQGSDLPARQEASRRDARGTNPPPHVPERPAPAPSPATAPAPSPPASPPSQPAATPPQPTPQTTPPPQPTPSPAAPIVAPTPVRPTPEPPSSSTGASTPAPSASEERRESAASRGSSPTPENDEAVIRRVVQNYGRAIESKDIDLFRRVKPNMSSDEQRRIEEGFRAVSSQQVNITIVAVEIHGQDASVRLRRRDTIQAGGRQQTTESLQTMTLVRSGSSWVIREIGR
jgi:hypothetical protein